MQKLAPESIMEKEQCLAGYESFKKSQAGKAPAWLNSFRDTAMSRFRATDFPTTQDEDWKYTSLDPLLKTAFTPAYEKTAGGLRSDFIKQILGLPGDPRMVFVNGAYAPAFSSLAGLSGKITMTRLENIWKNESELLERHWSFPGAAGAEVFSDLNSAFFQDGALIRLTENFLGEKPLELIYLSQGEVVSCPRNLVIAEKGSRAAVIERYLAADESVYFTNAVTDFVLEEGSSIELYRVQKESGRAFHISTTRVSSARDSHFVSFNLDFGGRMVRNHLKVTLQEEGGSCDLNGLYVAGDAQHIDNHTVLDHLKPHGTSRQLYKGILNGRARAVFSGKIFVRQDAQKTDASQKNKNLLLSEGARVDTQPRLEIFADDVKCAHGAAVGQLNDDEIFYLRSRGIAPEEAKKVLTSGFAHEITDRIRLSSVKNDAERWLEARLAGKEASDGKF